MAFATRILRPPASAKLDELVIGVCPGCGTLNAVYTDKDHEHTLWVLATTKGVRVVEAVDHRDAPCAICVGIGKLAFPKNQDLIIAAFRIGGWDAVEPNMITERGLRSIYRASRVADLAISAASQEMGGRRRRR